MSVTVDVNMNVKFVIDCCLQVNLNPAVLPPDLQLYPEVTDAQLQLTDFCVNRISHFAGPIVREMASTIRHLIEKKSARNGPDSSSKSTGKSIGIKRFWKSPCTIYSNESGKS
ncbi:MAG: hypothetical protein CMJ80_09905 [Planctomycetaceae bacterium]|nr:hypothetical protein [Planctomycetaceae bacterium]